MRVIGSRTTSGQWNSFSAVSKNQQHVKRGNGMSLKPDLVAAASKGKKEESASEMTSDAVAVTKPVRKRAKTKDSKESETKESEAALSTRPSALTPSPPVAVPFDAASLLKNAPPSESWHKPRYWVCFTDLHLSAKTSAICIEVLQRVHQEAVSRQGGIVFLGDFWDERGALPVEPLNAVLGEISSWTQPCLFLVGNHDQVDIGGSLHSLTPLKCARPDLIHVFDSPGFFRGALFLPYRRDKTLLQSAITAASFNHNLKAIMAHADIMGAQFNYAIQAREGLSTDIFPPKLPVYSGHYHLPHTVPNTSITYIGSCFQVTAAEAGEQKRLVVFDAEDAWSIKEEIPLSVGPRYIRVASLEELESSSLDLRAGDRVKVAISESAGGTDESGMDQYRSSDALRLEERKSALEARGIKVEVTRLMKGSGLPRISQAEDKGPDELLEEYAARARMPKAALEIAKKALGEELTEGGRAGGGKASRSVRLELGMLELEGYGPFKEVQQYNLSSRGLRAIIGQNEDEGSDSNGSGKTSLVTAPLWCLTGDMLARSESGASTLPIDAMLHDSSKEGRVKLDGRVNGKPFTIERAIRKGKTSRLSYLLDGVQLDQREIKGTQKLIDESFNTELLRLAVFFGQNDITTLLVSEDAALKQILSQVVEMDVWSASQNRVKEEQRVTQKALHQADGRMSLLEQQKPEVESRLNQVGNESLGWESSRAGRLEKCETELDKIKRDLTEESSRVRSGSSVLYRGLQFILEWIEDLDIKQRESSDALTQLMFRLKDLTSSSPSIPAPTLVRESDRDVGDDEDQEAMISWDAISTEVQESFSLPISTADEQVRLAENSLRGAQDEMAELKARVDLILKQIKQASDPAFSHIHDSSALVCDKCLMEVDPSKHSKRLEQMNIEAVEMEARRRDKERVVSELEEQKKSASDELLRLKKEMHMAIQCQFDHERQSQEERMQARQIAADAIRKEALQAWQKSQSEAFGQWEASVNSLTVEIRLKEKILQEIKDQEQVLQSTRKSLQSAIESVREILGGEAKELMVKDAVESVSRQEQALTLQQRAMEISQAVARLQQLMQLSTSLSIKCQSIRDEENPFTRQQAMVEQQIERLNVDLTELLKGRVKLQEHQVDLEEAEKALGRGGVQSFVLEGVLKEWEERSRGYLEMMTDGGMMLELLATRTPKKNSDEVKEVITKVVKIKKSSSEIIRRSIQQLSGGERRRVAIALSLGFSDLVRARGRLSCNLLILDEVMQQLDSEGCSRVALMLKSLPHDSILVVGQSRSFVESSIEIVDRVLKFSGCSFVSQQD